jgi:hypothetical protein
MAVLLAPVHVTQHVPPGQRHIGLMLFFIYVGAGNTHPMQLGDRCISEPCLSKQQQQHHCPHTFVSS